MKQPSPPIGVTIVGAPSAASDAAVRRWLERFLEAERPRTSWSAQPIAEIKPVEARRAQWTVGRAA